ncbi:MAG TPA: glycoside hydrolase family 15 protein [Streptomyces sp.]|nr:glycoside hydrolase family 15 protein [Streptomyces sp.]
MPLRLEDYALLGDTHTAALVGYDGSIDWLCLPRFDSGACFAALLGRPEHGRWLLAPYDRARPLSRRYRGDSLVLETEFASAEGRARVVDCMPVDDGHPTVVRLVEGLEGRVWMRSLLRLCFDYGHTPAWLRPEGRRLRARAGPDVVTFDADVDFAVRRGDCTAEFAVGKGDRVGFRLAWNGPRGREPEPLETVRLARSAADTERWWQEWADRCVHTGEYREAVVRSLVTLKALSHSPGGGVVAAPTTSLPERLGGVRNWDHRCCRLRGATATLLSLLDAGYEREAVAWREWLLRTLAGDPRRMQIAYGVEGERLLTETELSWLPGYEHSRPVRIGNPASAQFQLDVHGEFMDALHQARTRGVPPDPDVWNVQRALMDFLESHWRDPDNGIWEMRGPRRDFTHSKVMAWVAADRAVKAVEHFGLDGPADRWRRTRREIHREVCELGYDADRGAFTQYYGSPALDASLLLIPSLGFLPADDARVRGTAAAVEEELLQDGFVQRYTTSGRTHPVDGLPAGEGAFLPCTFWLADNHVLQGRVREGRKLFERLLELRNDLGLLSEEYDTGRRRLVGNFPQVLSHVPLVNTAQNLSGRRDPSQRR